MNAALFGFGLALSLAGPPGPMNALIASASTHGPWKGVSTGLGAVTVDAVFLVVVALLHGYVPGWVKVPVSLLGGVLLIWLGYRAYGSKGQGPPSAAEGYVSAVGLGLTNPYQLGWWLTAGLSMIAFLGYFSAVGFFAGLLAWVTAFPYAIWKLSSLYAERMLTAIRYASVVGLVGFGLFFILSGAAALA